jgi:haloalkane dehalogenase
MHKLEVKDAMKSKYTEVDGHKLHYVEAGEGETILFLHGMPTSSYLWRNILPELSPHAHCVAVDMMGMGLSDQPDIEYSVFDHIQHLEQFIANLNLTNITLVTHGWGSVIGLDYARRFSSNIAALALFESHIRPATEWDTLSLPVKQLATLLDCPDSGYKAIIEQNYLVRKLLPSCSVTPLSQKALDYYAKPFTTQASRKVLWRYIQDLPLGDSNSEVTSLIDDYSSWLTTSSIPKLLLYAVPGFITTLETVSWAKDNLSSLTLSPLDDVMHFAQESVPELFSEKLKIWYKTKVVN